MKTIFVALCALMINSAFAKNPAINLLKDIQYKTYFGSCPSRVAGKLTLVLMKKFEETNSLMAVKNLIVEKKMDEKHFLSNYKISYDPASKLLKFDFDCPKPVMKAQIYKENGEEFYTAILVDNGSFVDPTYEALLRAEKKLKRKLPGLAFPVNLIDSDTQKKMTHLALTFDKAFKDKLSEIILDEDKKLTMIFSIDRRPSSAFLGKDYWSEKVEKLAKVIEYMKKKKTIPAVINLTNSKKIVVKFSDTI
ncbi:MAG: hypothetical protein WEB87_06925 [Bacteriovoracaceae bacterium]